MSTSSTKIHVGMDVHKDTVMIAVLPEDAGMSSIVKQLPKRWAGAPPLLGPGRERRQEGLPPEGVAHCWKAQRRLHRLCRRTEERRIAVVAVARELAGFVWAVLQDVDSEAAPVRIDGNPRPQNEPAPVESEFLTLWAPRCLTAEYE